MSRGLGDVYKRQESKRQEEKQQEGPRGRYAESSIGISLEEGETAADIIQTGDQVLELYTVKDKKASRYIWTGEKWEKQDNSLLEGLEFPYGTLHMIWGEDKNRYVLYQGGDDYKTFMMKLTEGQEPLMLLDQVFSAKNEREYYDVRPDFAAVSEEGLIFLSHSGVTDVYTPEGGLVLTLPQKWSSMEWKGSGLLMGNRYITNGDSSYISYDISGMSASAKEEIPFQSPDFDMGAPMASDGSGGIYIANPRGIHHMNQGGSLWETVADGTLNSLSLPSANLRKLFVGNQNDFYVWMTQDEKEELKHYTYDPQMPSVPTQTLTVYGLNLEETDTCGCGGHGCLEQYASATGISRLARKKMEHETRATILTKEDLSAKAVFDAVKEGDEVAIEVATEMGNYLGHAMADMAAVLDPAVFVIGGGVSKAGEVLLSFIEKPFMEKAFFANKNVKFKLATLGNDAGICGAAKLVLED